MKEIIKEHLKEYIKSLLNEDVEEYSVCDQFSGNKEKYSQIIFDITTALTIYNKT
jgi:hypothetical protein